MRTMRKLSFTVKSTGAPPKQPRPKHINAVRPEPPQPGFSVVTMQCSACPDFHCNHIHPTHWRDDHSLHGQWHEDNAHHWHEHYVDHPGREAPCGGHCIITRDGKPFTPPPAPPKPERT